MNILMLNYEYPPLGGGAGNAAFYLLREFGKRNDITIDLVTSSPTGSFEKESLSGSVTIYKLPVRKTDPQYWRMSEIMEWTISAFRFSRKLIREHQYDLCHCWSGWPSGILGYLFRKEMPYIIALRGSDIPGYNPRLKILDALMFRSISRRVWLRACRVTVLSENSCSMAGETLDRDYIIIHNGVDTSQFYPVNRETGGIKILSVGRLIERKGIEYAIRAVEDVHAEYPEYDLHLTIVGSGILEERLKSLTRQLHLTSHVSFSGAVRHEKLPDIYREHDIFILPSLNEALGNVTQEAIASGLALLTTDTGAAELLDNNGFIVKTNDFHDISDTLSLLIMNPGLLRRFKQRSAEIGRTMSWKSCADSYIRVYASCRNG